MVVTCAFYGFVNRTTKVTLQVDREKLEVGRSVTFEGDQYVILSVFEAEDDYRANVGLEHLHRFRIPARLKAPTPSTSVIRAHGCDTVQEARAGDRLAGSPEGGRS